jgi:hypothetical protein
MGGDSVAEVMKTGTGAFEFIPYPQDLQPRLPATGIRTKTGLNIPALFTQPPYRPELQPLKLHFRAFGLYSDLSS